MKKENSKQKYLISLILISLIISIIVLYYNSEQILLVIASLTVAFICAILNFKLSKKIKSNSIIAYFIGLIFGIFGFLIYWIYYLIKKRR